jgi:ATP-dependent Lon protease
MATALASLLTGRPLNTETGMTGEITLRGKVLPVGGIKEKVLAAARFGLKTVILPKHNEADLDDVPPTVREQLNFVLVDTVDEVLAAALAEPVAPDGTGEFGPNGRGRTKNKSPKGESTKGKTTKSGSVVQH